jgi:heme a synthase
MQHTSAAYRRYTWFILLFIFLIILAGSIVRSTQSGMGCPDWPTCFGNLVPPTQMQQVQFQSNHQYKKGQFIIFNDSLKYAKQPFTSGLLYDAADWQQYEKHNYAKFEVYQTWIEYVNRVLTAIFGIFIFIHLIWSLLYWRKDKWLFFWSLGMFLLTGFEAWLGKVLVDTNLGLVQISLHMIGSLGIAAICVWLIHRSEHNRLLDNKKEKWIVLFFIAGLALQIVLGTKVRSEIDIISKQLGYLFREKWVDALSAWFQFHRVFALLLTGFGIYLFVKTNDPVLRRNNRGLIVLLLLELLLGFVLVAADMPVLAQPLHLVLSSALLMLLYKRWLRFR